MRCGRILAKAGHNAVHVTDLGLQGATDDEVLARAATEGRTVVTADTDSWTLLALTGAPGPNVVLPRRLGRPSSEQPGNPPSS
ncbi:MAG: DUF5615 family PIN-like protein [Pseudonocardiaceae bacterium]